MFRAFLGLLAAIGLALGAPPADAQRSGMGFHHFIETYEKMKPARVLQILSALNRTQMLILSGYARVSQDMLRRACRVRGDLWMNIQGRRTTCRMAVNDVRQALQWITMEQVRQNIRSERDEILIAMKCATGQIDRGTCAMYLKTTAAINRMRNDTSLRIIANIGNKCRVGVDPGCVAY